jgi:hypothetical protein
VLEEPRLAIAHLPKDVVAVASSVSGAGTPLSGWSRVCVAKGTYLKGTTHPARHAVPTDSV